MTPEQVKIIEKNLRKYVSKNINLVIRSVVSTDTVSKGYIPYYDESKFFPEDKEGKMIFIYRDIFDILFL